MSKKWIIACYSSYNIIFDYNISEIINYKDLKFNKKEEVVRCITEMYHNYLKSYDNKKIKFIDDNIFKKSHDNSRHFFSGYIVPGYYKLTWHSEIGTQNEDNMFYETGVELILSIKDLNKGIKSFYDDLKEIFYSIQEIETKNIFKIIGFNKKALTFKKNNEDKYILSVKSDKIYLDFSDGTELFAELCEKKWVFTLLKIGSCFKKDNINETSLMFAFEHEITWIKMWDEDKEKSEIFKINFYKES